MDLNQRSELLKVCSAINFKPDDVEYLRSSLLKKFQEMRMKDQVIKECGAKSLSEEELQQCCLERCLLTPPSVEKMCLALDSYVNLPVEKKGIAFEVFKLSKVPIENSNAVPLSFHADPLAKIYHAILESNQYQRRMAIAAETAAKPDQAIQPFLDMFFMADEALEDVADDIPIPNKEKEVIKTAVRFSAKGSCRY